ncbi:glutathione S-transferase family protein [soil metagenome]
MFQLYIADKNYSSWSMRPWVLMKAARIDFQETTIRLAEPGTAAAIAAVSPSRTLPVLHDGNLRIWDSLAIIEYLDDLYPQAGVWPSSTNVRAVARSVAAEMHAGFAALRQHMPMNIRARFPGHGRNAEVDADIARIVGIWQHSLDSFGGPYLYGQEFLAPDAMFAPVVMRFITYGVELPPDCQAYVQAVLNHPAVAAWVLDAMADPKAIERYDQLPA